MSPPPSTPGDFRSREEDVKPEQARQLAPAQLAPPQLAPPQLAPGLAAFAEALAAEPKARVPLARCRVLFALLPGGPPGDPGDPRRALADAFSALAAQGRLRLPSPRSRTGWDKERAPRLPRTVVVPQAPRKPRRSLSDALHPVLAHARDQAVGARLPADVDRLDAWLKVHGGGVPLLPLAERSYEIFGEEKRLGAFLKTRFAGQGGLKPETFGSYRVLEPFAMTPFDESSTWAIALENLASYDSACRVVADLPKGQDRPAAVIFGRGTQFTSSCSSLPERLPHVRRVLYVGDLDVTGLEVGLSAQATLGSSDVTLVPWAPVYQLMAEQPAQPVKKAPTPKAVTALLPFLPLATRSLASEILLTPGRVPQEAVGRLSLEQILRDAGSR